MIVTKTFMFHAAHHLPGYEGKCSRVHGHTYTLEVSVQGEIDKRGMVIDFKDLKDIVNDKILDRLDHSDLNSILEIPTAENIAVYMWDKLKPDLKNLYEIKLWETPTSYVTYRP